MLKCFEKNNDAQTLSKVEFINSLVGRISEGNEALNEKKKNEILDKILERAYDIRKFELDLYWKRATYFWGFLIAIFTAFFIAIDKSKNLGFHFQFLIICMGLVFSLAWYLVNRGSTYWATNYERVIDAIEEHKGICFYNLNLKNDNDVFKISYFPFSVSRINIAVSLFIVIIWLGLFLNSLYNNITNSTGYCISNCDWKVFFMSCATTYFAYQLIQSVSQINNSDFEFNKRGSNYKV